jgi:hypothetical protein
MNDYIADQIARQHADRLIAEAAAARRADRARDIRRSDSPSARSQHFVTRPFVAVRHWIVAGQL